MNKETKVGLLVGLSFIVLFGVILSNQAPDVVAPPEKPMISQPPQRGAQVQVIRQIEPAAPAPEPVDLVVDAAAEEAAPKADAAPVEPAPAMETAVAVAATEDKPADTTPVSAPSDTEAPKTITADNLGPETAESEPGDAEVELVSSKVAPDGTRTTVYIVKSGDCLAKISRQFYGDATSRNIDRIYEANKDKMPNKKTLKVGTSIQVPAKAVAEKAVAEKDKTADDLLSSGKFDEVVELKPAGKAKDAPAAKDPKPASEAKDAPKPKAEEARPASVRTAIAEVSDEALEDILQKRTSPQSPAPAAAPSKELARVVVPVSAEEQIAAPKKDPQLATKELDKTSLVSRENVRHYQIRKGDTWYKLAARFMGDSKRWQELSALNDDILPNAAKLRTGVKIRIPAGKGRQDSVE